MTASTPTYPRGEQGRIFDGAVSAIAALPWVRRMILFGSYAKGTQSDASDVDLAVFVDCDKSLLLEEYRQLTEICRSAELDIQVQVFHVSELDEPCGIIAEIVTYGIELMPAAGAAELNRERSD